MSPDLEMARWQAGWLGQEGSVAGPRSDLRRAVERKRQRMMLTLCGQLLLGAVLLAFSAWFASAHPALEWVLWAAVIWATTLFAVGFAIWNSAGTWKALQQSSAAFLDLSRRRCTAELRATRAGRWFLAVQLAIVAAWLTWDFARHSLTLGHYLFGIGATTALAAAYLAWFATRERRTLGDLTQLDEFERECMTC
jgi:hypothetical protein